MNKQVDEKALLEKAQRKDVARRRIYWFLIAFDVVLVIYLFIQFVILFKNR